MRDCLRPRDVVLLSAILLGSAMAGCPAPDDGSGDPAGDGGGSVLGNLLGGGSNDNGGGGIFGGAKNQSPTASVLVYPGGVVNPDAEVALDAGQSSDPDGDALSFEWSQLSGPAVSANSLTEPVLVFRAPLAVEDSELRLKVTVNDGKGGSASAEAVLFIQTASEFAGHPQAVLPYRDKMTSDEAYHLLRRAAFGATPEQVQAAVGRGLTATVDDLLTIKPAPDWLDALADSFEDDIPHRWMVYLIESANPLHERMAMFWHDRFATSRRVLEYNDRNLSVLHWQMLHDHALGNYRVFLEALTLDPLMLIWLDGGNSPKSAPNENYAREFWELFTLGRDVLYTEQDIREGARAFTGISLLRERDKDARPIYDLLNHDETPKSIFPGRAAPANYNYKTVIDLTLAQPEAARYVVRNLFVYFVHEYPEETTVDALAASFRDSGYQIAPLVRQILRSQAMFSSMARFNQVTTPVEHFVGVARTLDMHMVSEESQSYVLDRVCDDLAGSGQELLNPPGVEGWSENLAWLEDQWVITRVKSLGRVMEYGANANEDLPYHLLPPVSEWKTREVRERIVDSIARVFHLPLTAEERAVYVEVLDQDGWKAFHLEDPRYQPQHVFEMIRLMAMDERVIGR